MGDLLWNIDWHAVMTPTHSVLEMALRGTVMYFVIFGLMRVVLKRQAGGIGTADVLVIVLLIEDGKMLRNNMRAELVTKDELMAQLRENGIETCTEVKRACMEADGMISVIKMA